MKKIVLYVHEESKTIVSKQCKGCGGIKLKEVFPNGKEFLYSVCSDCEAKQPKEKVAN